MLTCVFMSHAFFMYRRILFHTCNRSLQRLQLHQLGGSELTVNFFYINKVKHHFQITLGSNGRSLLLRRCFLSLVPRVLL